MKVITICASSKFKPEIMNVAAGESLKGTVVLCSHVFSHYDGSTLTPHEVDILTQVHFKKIEMADEVFVLNIGGYIGEGLQKEIDYANKVKKPIIYIPQV